MTAESFNASVYLTERQVAAGRGDHVAVTGPAGTLTYAELTAQVAGLATGLRRLGVRPEERVLLVMSDRPETVVTILAVMRMGAVAVPVSTMYHAAELGELIRDARARVVVATPEYEPVASAALATAPEAETLITTGPGGSWAELPASGRPAGPAYDTWRDSPALWLYTSGTTGAPKAAMHRHGAIRDVYETYGRQVLGIRADDRCLSVARLFFAYGIGNSMFFPLAAGATAILDPARPTPAGVLGRVRAARSARSGSASRPARRCPPRSTAASWPATAWRSSTGSAPPRRCTSSSPTGPARCVQAPRARSCPATR
jgi:acyl-coenzyme A synthetase/AMP-(fatty) acid ligase